MLAVFISQQNLLFLTLCSLFSFLCPQVLAQVVWNDYPDIQSAQVTVYAGTQLIVDLTPSVSFSRPFTFSGVLTPVGASLGINGFEMPQTHDFSLLMNKSITGSTLSFVVQVADQSAFYKLTINYLVMFNNHAVYRIIDGDFYCTALTRGVGYRSEYHILTPNATGVAFFNSTDIETALVLEGIRLINTQGSYTFLGVTVNLPTPGIINTTFFTFEQNQIYFLKYSIICFKRSLAYVDMKEIFEIGYANYTFNMTLINIFISSIDTRYTSAPNRMFFGLRQFNFTYQNDKVFMFDVNSYSSLLTNYQFTEDTLVRIRLSFFFFVERTCSGATYFYKNLSSSSYDQCYAACGFSDRPVTNGVKSICVACHYSCLTCTGVGSSDCSSCSSENNRTISASQCPCSAGYVNVGEASCTPCWKKILGCHICTSTISCTSCRTGFVGTTSCVCPSGLVVSGFCSSIYGCTAISNISGTPLCTACDESLLLILAANFTCICQGGTTTLLNGTCKMNCGDGYVLTTEGCDDGNVVSGDGCSSTCKVEEDWLCIGIAAITSVCKISVVPNLQYIGIHRQTSQNRATMYFNLTPTYPQYKMIDYTGLLGSNLINSGFEITFDPYYHLLTATFDYYEDIEGTEHSFILYLNSTSYFWNPSDWAIFALTGVNCELTYDQALWVNTVLKYFYLAWILIAIGIFITSVFYEKWIGLQLMQTYQAVFFLSTLNLEYPFEFTGIYQTFKYSNGYDDLIFNPYPKIYTLSDQLIALSFEKEFLSNYNLMYFIVCAVLISMIVIGLFKRRYRMQLEEHISKKIGDKIKKLQRIYSVVFGRAFVMLVLFSMNKVIFCFCVQLSSEVTYIENLPDELNVIFAMIAFIMVFSVISFILYWYLLLPAGHNEEQEFMSLRFSNMSEYYPILYLAYQAILILSIAIGYALKVTIYVVLIIQILYLFLILYPRPYNTLRQLNKFLHNATIAFNQFTCIVVSYVVIRWNSIIGTPYQQSSNGQLTAYCFILLVLLMLCCVLAILRIAIFNKDVSLNCCKKEKEEFTDRDYDQMKKMMANEGAQKAKDGENPAQTMRKIADREEYIKKQTNNEEMLVNQSGLDRFLNAEHIHWVKNNSLIPENRPKVAKAKRTNSSKKAEMIKSPLQKYIEMKQIQQSATDKKLTN